MLNYVKRNTQILAYTEVFSSEINCLYSLWACVTGRSNWASRWAPIYVLPRGLFNKLKIRIIREDFIIQLSVEALHKTNGE